MTDLQSLCGDPMRESLATPFALKLDGALWNCATNGHAALLLLGEHGAALRDNAPPVSQILRLGKSTHDIPSWESFVHWLTDCQTRDQCVGCRGTGKHICDCFYCEQVKGHVCAECEGAGFHWRREAVRFEGVVFDRCLMARYVSEAPNAVHVELFLDDPLSPIEFRAEQFRVVAMPMRSLETGHAKATKIPEGLLVRRHA